MSMLRSIRERKGFTLGQLAGRAGIPARVLSDYEEGRQVIGLAHAKLLAKALWVGIEELIPPPGTEIPVPAPTNGTAGRTLTSQGPCAHDLQGQPRNAEGITRQMESHRPAPYIELDQHREPAHYSAAEQRSQRAPRTATPATSITEGQRQELMHLASRLQIDDTQLEERVGKSLGDLKRFEAKEWIKKLRGMADEVAPSSKVRYGRWPETDEDMEAVYLQEQKEVGAPFLFKLFNGETFTGTIRDFTPYTIIVSQDDVEVVLRKLAIAYYRRVAPDEGKAADKRPAGGKKEGAKHPRVHDHKRDDRHQPLDKGIDTDHVGTPDAPEEDNMDEDRGA